MELVDMRDLGSRAEMCVGSSPFRRTKTRSIVHSFVGYTDQMANDLVFYYVKKQKTHKLRITWEVVIYSIPMSSVSTGISDFSGKTVLSDSVSSGSVMISLWHFG